MATILLFARHRNVIEKNKFRFIARRRTKRNKNKGTPRLMRAASSTRHRRGVVTAAAASVEKYNKLLTLNQDEFRYFEVSER